MRNLQRGLAGPLILIHSSGAWTYDGGDGPAAAWDEEANPVVYAVPA